jgi:cytoskeletal protein CcmA (bactofilin family)
MPLLWTLFLFALTLLVFSVPLWPALVALRQGPGANVFDIDAQNDGSAAYASLKATTQAADGETAAAQEGHVQIAAGQTATTLHCTGTATVGAQARVNAVRAHSIVMQQGSCVVDVASATHVMYVAPDCTFTWLDAPSIHFTAAQLDNTSLQQRVALLGEKAQKSEQSNEKFTRHEGDWQIQPEDHVTGHHVVTGNLMVAANTIVRGHFKVYGSATVGESSHVLGNIFANNSIDVQNAAYVAGVLSAGEKISLHAHAVIGTKEQLSSVTARHIDVQAGAVVHGSLRAHVQGLSKA